MDPGERSCFEVLGAISLLERIQARSVTVENEDKLFAGIRHRLDAAIFHGAAQPTPCSPHGCSHTSAAACLE